MADTRDAIDRARDALARGAWPEAYDGLHAADRSRLGPADLEGLADAAWWCSHLDESLEVRQKAYAAYAAAGQDSAAGAVAARLCIEHFVRDEPSVATGFLMRAHRHLKDLPIGPEHGFLQMVEANVARFAGETESACALAHGAADLGRRFKDHDLAAMAIHTEGLVLIDAGRVPEGIALMDEAMASVVAGELNAYFTGIIYCNLIQACLEISDVRRAGEWSDAARTWCDTLLPGSPYPGMCRVNRAEVARLRGAWAEAEAEAMLASEELASVDPQIAASAFVQVGEVRRRRGDVAGAEAAFARGHELGGNCQPGMAMLRLAQGKVAAAGAALRSALEGEQQRPRRAWLLAAQVEVAIAAGDLDEARAAAGELDGIAREAGTRAFAAAAATAAGAIQLAAGDQPSAMVPLRSACAAWLELKLPYEAARARALLAQSLRASGDAEGAELELHAALAAFDRLGAVPDAAATTRLLAAPGGLPNGLTGREAEVLRLVAAGKTNRDIAVELVISEHTVARHLQNMFAKLGVSSRSAATAFAFGHGLA